MAEEIAQDVMLELWRRRTSLTVETSLQAYLYRATRNRALNHVRHERVETESIPYLERESAIDSPAPREMAEKEIRAAVQRAVAKLPDRCREVFGLSRNQGLKYSEIANALGISVKTVEAQMGKALAALRIELQEWIE